MNCYRCGKSYASDDVYCSRCGATLRWSGQSVAFGGRNLPVPWDPVRSSLVRGVALLAAGTAIELLRRQVTRWVTPTNVSNAITRLLQARPRRRRTEAQSIPGHVQPPTPGGQGIAEVRAYFFRHLIIQHREYSAAEHIAEHPQ